LRLLTELPPVGHFSGESNSSTAALVEGECFGGSCWPALTRHVGYLLIKLASCQPQGAALDSCFRAEREQ